MKEAYHVRMEKKMANMERLQKKYRDENRYPYKRKDDDGVKKTMKGFAPYGTLISDFD